MDHPIKVFRLGRKLTREALGKELGVTAQTIYRWENGTRCPRRRTVSRLAQQTGLSEAEIMGLDLGAAQ